MHNQRQFLNLPKIHRQHLHSQRLSSQHNHRILYSYDLFCCLVWTLIFSEWWQSISYISPLVLYLLVLHMAIEMDFCSSKELPIYFWWKFVFLSVANANKFLTWSINLWHLISLCVFWYNHSKYMSTSSIWPSIY